MISLGSHKDQNQSNIAKANKPSKNIKKSLILSKFLFHIPPILVRNSQAGSKMAKMESPRQINNLNFRDRLIVNVKGGVGQLFAVGPGNRLILCPLPI